MLISHNLISLSHEDGGIFFIVYVFTTRLFDIEDWSHRSSQASELIYLYLSFLFAS